MEVLLYNLTFIANYLSYCFHHFGNLLVQSLCALGEGIGAQLELKFKHFLCRSRLKIVWFHLNPFKKANLSFYIILLLSSLANRTSQSHHKLFSLFIGTSTILFAFSQAGLFQSVLIIFDSVDSGGEYLEGREALQIFHIYIMSRPENQLPPELWYNVAEASKYESNTRIQNIQRQLGERAIELLNIQAGSLVLDIGCGSGISGETLRVNEFVWEGIDISRDMLNIAAAKEDSQGGLWQVDIGQGWKFRAGVFDGAVSVSTIQWLCVASRKNDNPFKRCCKFFQSLYDCLRIGGRAVLQFYPDGKRQLEMITTAAMKSGFSGGLIVDYPNSSRAKKYFLVLEAGVRRNLGIVQSVGKTGDEMQEQQQLGEGEGEGEVKVNKEKQSKKETFGRSKKKIVKRKQFVIKKKQRLRRRGLATRPDTKYTGRRRKPKF